MSPINLPYQINLSQAQQPQQKNNSTKQLFPHRLSSGSACDTCRRRKTKCDGGSPCAYCANNNMQCIHRPSKRKRAAILIAKNNPLKKDSPTSSSASYSSNSSSGSPVATLNSTASSTNSLPLLLPSEYKLEASDYRQSFSNPLKTTLTHTERSFGMPSMMGKEFFLSWFFDAEY
jgi:hypothetical protein